METVSHINKVLALPLVVLIQLYQKTISPDHSRLKVFFPYGYCPFYPSCSQYCIDSFRKHGLVPGLTKGLWRIVRCHPWTHGGIDHA